MKSANEKELEYIKNPEFVIGLVGPAGLKWDNLTNILEEEFRSVNYDVAPIQLSHLIEEIFGKDEKEEDEYARVSRLMNQGDDLRNTLGHSNAVGLLSVAAIQRARENINVKDKDQALPDIDRYEFANVPLSRYAYILRSLKKPEEVELFRTIYGDCFFLIAAYSSHDARRNNLAEKIAATNKECDSEKYFEQAEELIYRDRKDSDNPKHGQNVRDTFALADLFVDVDDHLNLRASIKRFVQAMFGYQFHTPSRDEHGMFHARAASRRSAALPRQVGATITTSEGDIVAVGCNEVPKAGGGSYWAGDDGDYRDYHLGKNINDDIIKDILREAVDKLQQAACKEKAKIKIIADLQVGPLKDEIVKNSDLLKDLIRCIFKELDDPQTNAFQGARIKGILEFNRIVHGEMAALINAALRGISVRDGTMYVTTFPCHLCAPHIVAAGIKRVVYIEPYPKSMVSKLYRKRVTEPHRQPVAAMI